MKDVLHGSLAALQKGVGELGMVGGNVVSLLNQPSKSILCVVDTAINNLVRIRYLCPTVCRTGGAPASSSGG